MGAAPAAGGARALLAPKCQVPGCQKCRADNPSKCDVCKAKSYLSVSTGACACLPGHFARRNACARCPKGRVSPGGAQAACAECPAGRVANGEQSECIDPSGWGHWGGDLSNRRWSQTESRLSPKTAGALRVKWEADVVGSTSATPTVHKGSVYVPNWKGQLYRLDAETGSVIWSKEIKDYLSALGDALPANLGVFPVLSRTSPVIYEDTAIVGTMQAVYGGHAFWLAVRTSDGSLVWGRRADDNVAAVVTMSPTLFEGVLYTGVSSLEENVASRQAYECCTFRGRVVALDARTGAVVWRTFTTPAAPPGVDQSRWWSGAAVWGSSPAIDRQRGHVIISTGDNYKMPDEVEACLGALGNLTAANSAQQRRCMQLADGANNHHNAIIALDLRTGAIKWSNRVDGPDAWNAACLSDNPLVNDNCPATEGPDFDFAQAPMLVSPCRKGRGCRQLLVVGQKSGIVWALDPNDGQTVWHQKAGPGGLIGGLMWGGASDNQYVYFSNNNHERQKIDFAGEHAYLKPVPKALIHVSSPGRGKEAAPPPPPASAEGGLCVALDAWDGAVKWTFANPARDQAGRAARSLAPVTVANGVVAYASMDPKGTLFLLRAADGKLLGSYELGASSACGPAVVDGVVYSGSGYSNFAQGGEGTKVVALAV